jgi:tetratricopeptide (TPR) repeat protein
MRPVPRVRVTRWAVLAVALGLSVSTWSNQEMYGIRSSAIVEETMFIPSPHVLRRISLGYHGLLADLYWTRAVQYFGHKHVERALRFDLLYPLLDSTVTLDPHLTVAYSFGAVFLAQTPPAGAGRPDVAAQFVERGIRDNPDDWHLYYNLGFIHYFERKDYLAAADAFERGARVPGAHPWLQVIAAYMRAHGGDIYGARYLWTNIYESTTDKMIKQNAAEHLVSLQVDSDIINFEALIQAYRERTGKLPVSWREMYEAGWLHTAPRDPSGDLYALQPDGHVLVAAPKKFPFITKGLPPGQQSLERIPGSASN